MTELPKPLNQYLILLKNRERPFYGIALIVYKDMEKYLYEVRSGKSCIYTANLRRLREKIEKEGYKMSSIGISRILRALFFGSNLRWYATTSSGGKKNYHVELDKNALNSVRDFLGIKIEMLDV